MKTNSTLRCVFLVTLFPCLSLQAESPDASETKVPPAVPITVTEVTAEHLEQTVPAAGTVFSRNSTQITAGVAARIAWIAEPGDYLAAGQVMAKFDCEVLSLRRQEHLAVAAREQIRFESLEREIERLELATMATSVIQLERVRADRDLAAGEIRIVEVRVRQVDNELERCIELAPFSGVVTEQLRRHGEDVALREPLLTMTDINNLEVRAAVPIRYLPRVRAGVATEVRMNEVQLAGTIRTAVPAANAMSQTFEVRIDLPRSAPEFVAAGQLVSVALPLVAKPALTVPRDSIVLRADGAHVMRIDVDRTAQQVEIEVADASGERVAVRGELEAGDRVAVRGAEALDDGELVAIFSDT